MKFLPKPLSNNQCEVEHESYYGHVFCPVTFGYITNNSSNAKISFLYCAM